MKTPIKSSMASIITLALAALALIPSLAPAQPNYATPYTISTLAGTAGFSGPTDGLGSNARFDSPSGVAMDNAGNAYVADSVNNTIRKVTPAGFVSTLAGTPWVQGTNDGTSSNAQFNYPSGVAVDSAGNVYVADTDNDTIRKITPAGVVTTIAGSPGIPGDSDGPGASAQFFNPSGVAVDSAGNLYVVDGLLHKITTSDGTNWTVSTPAVSFNQLAFPTGVAVDSQNTVYVADNFGAIWKVSPSGDVTSLAGTDGDFGFTDGWFSAALFNNPTSVAVDGAGNVYVADSGNSTIREVTTGGYVYTLAGSPFGNGGGADGTGSSARFMNAAGVAVDSAGSVYVADTGNNTIRKGFPAGELADLGNIFLSSGTLNPAFNPLVTNYSASLGPLVTNVTVTPIILDSAATIQMQFNGGSYIYVASGAPSAPLILSPGDNTVKFLVTGADGVTITIYTLTITRQLPPAYTFTTLAGSPGYWGSTDATGAAARFYSPMGVAVDSAGNVYVADVENAAIRKVTPAGLVTTLAGSGDFFDPVGVAVDNAGNLYIADGFNFVIRKMTMTGGEWSVAALAGWAGQPGAWDGTGSAAGFYVPTSVAVDGAGNVYVADRINSTIRKVTPAGVVTTLAGSVELYGHADGMGSAASFNYPSGVAVDRAGQTIYVADTDNSTIRKMTLTNGNWMVTTLAGTANIFDSADGTGPAAHFNHPTGVAVDGAGNVYVADNWNSTIRRVTPAGVVTTLGGLAGNAGSTDGVGTNAFFYNPNNLAVDSAGNVYVADSGNNTIRMGVPAAGYPPSPATVILYHLTQTYDGTIKGIGVQTYPNNLAVSVTYNGSSAYPVNAGSYSVVATVTDPHYTGSATNTLVIQQATAGVTMSNLAQVFNGQPKNVSVTTMPLGLPVNVTYNGSVIPAEFPGNYTVVASVIDSNYTGSTTGTLVVVLPSTYTPYTFTTIAGNANLVGSGLVNGTGTNANFTQPDGLAVDNGGNVYVADAGDNAIRKMTPTSGNWVVSTLASGFPLFNSPSGVALDSAGQNLLVAGGHSDVIQKVTLAGVVTTLAGKLGIAGSADGTGTNAQFRWPSQTAVDNANNVYVTDFANDTIRKVTPAGVVATLAGRTGGNGSTDGTGTNALFNFPVGLAVDNATNVYVADSQNYTIRKMTTTDGISWKVTTLAGSAGVRGSWDGTGTNALFYTPRCLAVDSSGNNLYVCDGDTIRRMTLTGGNWVVTTLGGMPGLYGQVDGAGSNARFYTPVGVAVDNAGHIYVTDEGDNLIRMGVPTTITPATVTLGNLTQTYDGSSKSVSFTTAPAGLPVSVTYDGSASLPVNVGHYTAIGVVNSGAYQGAVTNTFTILPPENPTNVTAAQSITPGSGQSATASTAPHVGGQSGLTVTATNGGGGSLSVVVANYATLPASVPFFSVGAAYVDIWVMGATGGDSLTADFYFSSTITGAQAAALTLNYWNGSSWNPVLSSRGQSPTKTISPNLDGTTSGGKFHVTFDSTSTPTLAGLSGTVIVLGSQTVASGPPNLGITQSGTNVVVSWPAGSYALLQNSNLTSGSWVTNVSTVTASNGTNRIILTAPTGKLFFRLIQ